MKILVSGSAGFIGYHLVSGLTTNIKNTVIGIDSVNGYYSTKVKKLRLKILKQKKNFNFKKINLENTKKLEIVIKNFQPDTVFHIAGQPGVLYSFKNPLSYKKNNINATKNLSLICKKYKIKKFIFASSSSVYGDQKKFPIKENFKKIQKIITQKQNLSVKK